MNTTRSCAVFLFAHQDDEAGVFQKILDEHQAGHRVLCVYLTDGAASGQSSARRNQESLAVLSDLGITKSDVIFAGDALHIQDGHLLKHLTAAQTWLEALLVEQTTVSAIYLPAWEGGHHDHDALHALGVTIAMKLGLEHNTWQYALYNAFGCVGPFFRVFLPLDANGPVRSSKVSWSNRLRFLRYCLSYPSQAVTWLGLFPFMLLHYLFWGTQRVQHISSARIQQRPHKGPLYYENRKFCTYDHLRLQIDSQLFSVRQNRDQTS